MKRAVSILLFIFAFAGSVAAQADQDSLNWYSEVTKAYEASQSTHRPIFAFFTGSDWCGWCHKLQREVFSKPEFVTWANENVILLELDFPRNKRLPDEIVQQNQALQQFFQVGGYPTIWIFNMGRDESNRRFVISPFGSLGYPAGAQKGKEEVKFLETANAILAKKTP